MKELEYVNLRHRNEYVESIEGFVKKLEIEAENNRSREFKNEQNKELLRRKFYTMLGSPITSYVPDSNVNVKTESLAKQNNMLITRYQLEVMPGFWFYGMLYEHEESSRSNKNALVIAQHGGGGDPEVVGSLVRDSENYNHMVERIIQKDISVFAPQLLIWNLSHCEGKEYDRIVTDMKLKQLGGSITGLEVYCIMRCIDYFAGVDWIDENRIGMIGLSYGGMYTLYTAAADTRIKVALSSCWFNDRFTYNRPDWAYFDQAYNFMDAEVASLVLPRKLYIEIGDKDELFDPENAKADIERLHDYAEKEGCIDSLVIEIFDGLHELNTADHAINFFLQNL